MILFVAAMLVLGAGAGVAHTPEMGTTPEYEAGLERQRQVEAFHEAGFALSLPIFGGTYSFMRAAGFGTFTSGGVAGLGATLSQDITQAAVTGDPLYDYRDEEGAFSPAAFGLTYAASYVGGGTLAWGWEVALPWGWGYARHGLAGGARRVFGRGGWIRNMRVSALRGRATAAADRPLWVYSWRPFKGRYLTGGGGGRVWANAHRPGKWNVSWRPDRVAQRFLRTGHLRPLRFHHQLTGAERANFIRVRPTTPTSMLWKRWAGQYYARRLGNVEFGSGLVTDPTRTQIARHIVNEYGEWAAIGIGTPAMAYLVDRYLTRR